MKTVIIVQARTGSSRLPGKILKEVLGQPVLIRQLERISKARQADAIVVATSLKPEDDIIEKLSQNFGYNVFRGSLNNLLDRHYKAAIEYGADVVVKIPSDCPLIDPLIIDRVLEYYKDYRSKYDFVSNLHPATYPDGNDVEVMPFEVLKHTWKHAEKSYELEHTTPYIWDHPDIFRIGNVEWESEDNYSMSHRFTLDYQSDFDFINRVYEELYQGNNNFSLEDILGLLEEKPEIMKINEEYNGVNWYRNHLHELETVKQYETRII